MGSHNQVLYVGASTPPREEHIFSLEERGIAVVVASNAGDAFVRLENDRFDCIVSGASIPDVPLLRFYNLVEERFPSTPHFIVGSLEDIPIDPTVNPTAIEYIPNEEMLADVVHETITSHDIDEAIAQHHELIGRVHSIAGDLHGAETVEEIRQLVYDHVQALDRYRFVWIATCDADADHLELHAPTQTRMSTGQFASLIGAQDTDFIQQSMDRGTVTTTTGTATTRGAAAEAPTLPSTSGPTNATSSVSGVVTAAVPFVHEATVHGLLLLSTPPRTPGDLAGTERDVLAEVGQLVGRAIAALASDRDMASEEFASVVVHELVNPLNVAQSCLEQYRETNDSEWIDKSERALDRMEHVLTDELSLLRGEELGALTIRDLATDASEAWATLDTADAELVVEQSHDIRADHALVEGLLSNLFDNALTHGGDAVTVTIGTMKGGFYVADDGPGIPDGEQPRVFEFGHTTGGGTGLGLAIVKRIVEAHDWGIRIVESEAGGARFEIFGVEIEDTA